jgi:hypothetical protein
MSPEHRTKLLAATREAAIAFVEDMPYLRTTSNQFNPERSGIRRLSGTLRRLLVESDLTNIAAPRIGRLSLLMLDNEPIYGVAQKHPYEFFGSSGVSAFGVCFRAAAVEQRLYPKRIKHFDPERMIEVRLDNDRASPMGSPESKGGY